MKVKGDSEDGNGERVIEQGRKVDPVTQWQRIWLNYVRVLVFRGRQNLQGMKLAIELRRFLSRVVPPDCLL